MNISNQNRITALYCRLSSEDENKGDSESIVHQKEILTRYAKDNGFENVEVFADDGYSGVNFNRPEFQRLLALMEQGRVATLITKDLSRLGRNYIEVGNYTEILFPKWHIRYIAVNDNFDSLNADGNELAPFKNLFNEWFARDTSKKIRTVIQSKAESGKRVGTTTPYGYKRDLKNDGMLVIDEEVADNVRLIFQLCVSGMEPANIAKELKKRQILKPSMYSFFKNGSALTRTDMEDVYGWNCKTVGNILENELYIGNTVNCKTSVVSYKDKRKEPVPKEKQYRFENTHEAIIDKETWNIVQRIRGGKKRVSSAGIINKYSGILYCADCGAKLYFKVRKKGTPKAYSFICSNYSKHLGKELCTRHYIREMALDRIILEEIRKVTAQARTKTTEFAEYIRKQSCSQSQKTLRSMMTELGRMQTRNEELDKIFRRIYEDNILGRISDEQFHSLSDSYMGEQQELKNKMTSLKCSIEQLQAESSNIEKFIAIAKKYTDIQELTPEILHTFIAKIVVHEREEKNVKYTNQQIDIYFTHIGNVI